MATLVNLGQHGQAIGVEGKSGEQRYAAGDVAEVSDHAYAPLIKGEQPAGESNQGEHHESVRPVGPPAAQPDEDQQAAEADDGGCRVELETQDAIGQVAQGAGKADLAPSSNAEQISPSCPVAMSRPTAVE